MPHVFIIEFSDFGSDPWSPYSGNNSGQSSRLLVSSASSKIKTSTKLLARFTSFVRPFCGPFCHAVCNGS